MKGNGQPVLLILNQMAGRLAWEFLEDFADRVGPVAILTGQPETLAKEKHAGILVSPAVGYIRGGNYPLRLLKWMVYCVQAFFWLRRWPTATPMLVFATPPVLPWLAYLLQKLQGRQYAVMVFDIYPDVLVRLGKISGSNPVTRIWKWWNGRAYEAAQIVMTLERHMARILEESFNPAETSHGQIETIYPWADTAVIRPLAKEDNWFALKHGQLGKLTVMYSGNMGVGHDLETLLTVAEDLREVEHIHFMFIGSGLKWSLVEEIIRARKLRNATLLPWQAEAVLPFSLAAADIAFISLEEELAGIALPSKTFSFLAAGVPLLVSCGVSVELVDIVTRFQCGWRVPPKNPGAVHAVLEEVRNREDLDTKRQASRRAAEEIGSRENSRLMGDMLARVFAISQGTRGSLGKSGEKVLP